VLFQNKIEELSTQLDDVRTNLVDTEHQLTKAKRAQKEAEREMTVAQDQSETAYVNLHKVQQQLTEQKQRADVAQAGYFQMGLQLTAKDKIISELKAQLSAALEHPPQ
jgi:chromosome segregation ATPase